MKISFHLYPNKTNFHMKSFVLSFAFLIRFREIQNWLINNIVFIIIFLFSTRYKEQNEESSPEDAVEPQS